MSFSMEQMKDWVEDLAGKIRDLHSKIRDLEEENKTLKLKLMNQELTAESHVEDDLIGRIVEGHGLEEVNLPPLPKEIRGDPGFSKQGIMSAAFRMNTVTTKTNPLEKESIVKHLMGFVRPMDLLKCRQVSKLWKKLAQKDLQEKVTFHIDKHHLNRIRKFMECAENGFPEFRNLRLDLDGYWPETKEKVRALFRSYGKNLHKLQLSFRAPHFTNYWSMDDLRDIFLGCLEEIRELEIHVSPRSRLLGERIFLHDPIGNTLRNLSVLKLGLNRTDSDQTSAGYKNQVFIDLLRLAPNLKTLIWASDEEYQSTQLIQCLIRVNPIKLENLHIRNSISKSALESLGNSHLKLKELYLAEYKGFGLKLISSQSGKSGATPRQSVFGEGIWGAYLKTYLETILNESSEEHASCTELLQIFTAVLDNNYGMYDKKRFMLA